MLCIAGLRSAAEMVAKTRHARSKRGATLWALEQNGICSRDLKTKIFHEIFPTTTTIKAYLGKKGLSFRGAPDIIVKWGMDDIVAQEGAFGDQEFGIHRREQEWLKKLCNILGLKYNVRRFPHERIRRAYEIEIPATWYFNPQRNVQAKEMCWLCRKLMLKTEIYAYYDMSDCKYCAPCYEELREARSYRLYC